jgi:hypothetical protein
MDRPKRRKGDKSNRSSENGPTTINEDDTDGSGRLTPDRVRELYRAFPDELKRQVNLMVRSYTKDLRVLSTYRMIMGHGYNRTIDRMVLCYALVEAIPAFEIAAKSNIMAGVRCYNERGHLIELQTILTEGKHVRLFTGLHLRTGRQVIVKLYQSGSGRDTSYENDLYRKLGKPEPCFSTSYYIWGCPVLVMAPLLSLDTKDDEYVMAIQVILQLRRLHRFGVHCDLKPGNIMKRLKAGRPHYLVIDFGGATIERYGRGLHGYRRWVWSPKWTSQPRRSENGGKEVIATAKNDLIELGFTMKTLQNERNGIINKRVGNYDPIRSGFSGRLAKYMEYVARIDDSPKGLGVTDADRQTLIRILGG